MKKVIVTAICLVLVVAVGLTTILVLGITGVVPSLGWGGNTTRELVNLQVFDASDIDALNVSYSSDEIEILPATGNELVLEEYMTRNDESYKATTALNGGTLSIRAGERPFAIGMWGFSSRIKLYLPQNWGADVRIENTSGKVEAEVSLNFNSLTVKNTSGSIKLYQVEATGDIHLENTSGSIKADLLRAGGSVILSASSGSVKPGSVYAQEIRASCSSGSIQFDHAAAKTVTAANTSGGVKFDRIEGDFELSTSSGSVDVNSGSGQGSAKSTSGSVDVTLEQLEGDLSLTSTSGGCKLELSRGTEFELYCNTGSGSIKVPQEDAQRYSETNKDVTAVFGQAPEYRVNMQATSGSVKLSWI